MEERAVAWVEEEQGGHEAATRRPNDAAAIVQATTEATNSAISASTATAPELQEDAAGQAPLVSGPTMACGRPASHSHICA